MNEDAELRPRLRPLEVFRTTVEGRPAVALRDPTGATDRIALVPPAMAILLAFMDGTNTLGDLQAELMRRLGQLVAREHIAEIVRRLDEALLLDSPRFRTHVADVEERFLLAPTRAAVHAGKSYPDDPAELAGMLDGFLPAGGGGRAPRAILAPHIDFGRGGPAYGQAYLPLRETEPPDLFVVFGTDHNGGEFRFTLTRKSYDTPAGPVATDGALVDEMAGRLGKDGLFTDELHHRAEHSIEFQVVMIRHLFPRRHVRVLPVLCGSMHRLIASGADPRAEPEAERFFAALAQAVRGRSVCWIAGADLAHVGPRFGDPRPLSEGDRRALRESDARLLECAAAGDEAGFFRAIAGAGDRNRVCGTSAIYAMLRMLDGAAGRVAAYEQCPADEDGGSLVSIASVVYGTGSTSR
jgi:MEMO1 family protein